MKRVADLLYGLVWVLVWSLYLMVCFSHVLRHPGGK